MKRFLIFLIFPVILIAAIVMADTVKVNYGGIGDRPGYPLDSALILDLYGNNIDTLLGPLTDGDSETTVIDTYFVISGVGTHRVSLMCVYDGYSEWYEDRWWELTLSTSAEIAGDDLYSCTLCAVDTSTNPDSNRAYVKLDINLADGSDWLNPTTGTDGCIIVKLDSGSYIWSASSQRQIWEADQTLTVNGNMSDSLMGYSTYTLYVVSAPADTNLCVIDGLVRYNDQTLVKNAKVQIIPPDYEKNTCDSTFIVAPKPWTTWTGPWQGYSDGYFIDTVLKCSCMPDTLAVYKIIISAGNKVLNTLEINIPRDSGTYHITAFSE